MTIGGVPLPVSIWKGVRVLVEPANVIIINGDDSTTGLPRARREGDEQAEQTYDKCVSHNYGARKIIDEDEDYVQCMASFGSGAPPKLGGAPSAARRGGS